ncbi:MAG: hypothetical protein AAFY91_12420 [Bacteroidota bacterium]
MILRFYIALLVSTALFSCKSLETKCIERFPTTTKTEVREVTYKDTIIIPWNSVEFVDTTYCPPNLTDTLEVIKSVIKSIPGDTIYREYVCTDTVLVNQDEELVQYLRSQQAETLRRLEKYQRKSYTRLWLVIGLGLLIIGYTVFRIVRLRITP